MVLKHQMLECNNLINDRSLIYFYNIVVAVRGRAQLQRVQGWGVAQGTMPGGGIISG